MPNVVAVDTFFVGVLAASAACIIATTPGIGYFSTRRRADDEQRYHPNIRGARKILLIGQTSSPTCWGQATSVQWNSSSFSTVRCPMQSSLEGRWTCA